MYILHHGRSFVDFIQFKESDKNICAKTDKPEALALLTTTGIACTASLGFLWIHKFRLHIETHYENTVVIQMNLMITCP